MTIVIDTEVIFWVLGVLATCVIIVLVWSWRAQAREQTLPSKVEAPLHGSSSGKENTISNVTRSEE